MTTPTAAALARIPHVIAAEIGAGAAQVQAAIGLLDEGATVPFIARYRKEATGGLDDIQLRELEIRLSYLRELAGRREAVLGVVLSPLDGSACVAARDQGNGAGQPHNPQGAQGTKQRIGQARQGHKADPVADRARIQPWLVG